MIKRINLNEQIYQALKLDILEQRIGFGEKLANRELQERFGVSSTPIRDAINRLYNDGFVENITNVGARVIAFDVNMALDVNEVIAALHREAIAMSLNKGHKDELIPILQQHIDCQTQLINTDEYFLHDRLFHQSLFDYCENECLKKILFQHSGLWKLLVLYYYKYKNKNSDRERAIIDHRNILAACKEGDIAAAQAYVEVHFHGAVESLAKITCEEAPPGFCRQKGGGPGVSQY